jgi:hypothetical protein
VTAMAEQTRTGWMPGGGRPGSLGVVFAAVWLVFLVTPAQ